MQELLNFEQSGDKIKANVARVRNKNFDHIPDLFLLEFRLKKILILGKVGVQSD